MTIQENVQYAINCWKLKNLTAIYETDMRAVYSGWAESLGAVIHDDRILAKDSVVLKVNLHKNGLATEYGMLKELDGHCSCRVYAYDGDRGLLLEERIQPGTVLRKVEAAEERVRYFLTIFRNIHKEVSKDSGDSLYETYLDWLRKADAYCSGLPCRNQERNPYLAEKMHLARCIGEEMFAKYPDRVLLHGDLHHDNMLQNSEGGYTMIDPKGVIGPTVFDLPRYLMNEFDYITSHDSKEAKAHLDQIIAMIGKSLRIPVSDIRKLLFMEVMLGNIWCVEDDEEPDMWQIAVAAELAMA